MAAPRSAVAERLVAPVGRLRVVSSDLYAIVDVSTWELTGVEPDGQREHPWLRSPATDLLWLFKPVTVRETGQQGEDWSEKVASEIGVLLEVPCAAVDLATRDGREGCISQNVTPRGWEIQPGGVLLSGLVPEYQGKTKERRGHSLTNVIGALREFTAPPGSSVPPSFSAFDVFTGYLVFDAVIANRDRHDYNWSVLRPPPGEDVPDALCASYDHASSLAFNVTDAERVRRLQQGTVEAWAQRGTAYKFEREADGKSLTLVALARAAMQLCSADVRSHWRDAVSDLSLDRVQEILSAVPGLSDAAASFAIELVTINRRRLLSDN